MFWIYRMEPGSTREINITHNSNSHAIIDSKVTYFTSKQVPRTADRTKATGTFHFDEQLTCNGEITFQLTLPSAAAPPSRAPTIEPPPPPALADLELVFVESNGLAVIVKNKPRVATARDPKYLVSLSNLDEIGAFMGLPAFRRTDSGDFIKPGDFGFGASRIFDFTGPGAPLVVGRLKQGIDCSGLVRLNAQIAEGQPVIGCPTRIVLGGGTALEKIQPNKTACELMMRCFKK
jgi:hypothetical protein